MYVCMCRAFTDEDINSQIACGHTSVNKIGRSCGAGGDCGACVKKIQALLRANAAEQSPAPACAEAAPAHCLPAASSPRLPAAPAPAARLAAAPADDASAPLRIAG